jgi:hypothetical protein
MSHAQAAEALETDVRDLRINLRSRWRKIRETKRSMRVGRRRTTL